MLHLLHTVFGFLRGFMQVVSHALSTTGQLIHRIIHEAATAFSSLGLANLPVSWHGGRQLYAIPVWGVLALSIAGFALLVRYSELKPSSARVDLLLSGLVGIIGMALLGLLN